jgi:hypothetical protein
LLNFFGRQNLSRDLNHHDTPSSRAARHHGFDGDAVRKLRIACTDGVNRRRASQGRTGS